MDAKQREQLRQQLIAEKERIEAELRQMEEENRVAYESGDLAGDDNFEDQIGDSASITFERERDFSLENNLRDLLAQVNKALQRIKDGNYGICLDCGQPIAGERLEAIPYTELCINCQKKREGSGD